MFWALLTIPFIGTVLGSSMVFLLRREMAAGLEKTLLGFASGVMVAASFWSLLAPALEWNGGSGAIWIALSFLGGVFAMLVIDELTPHMHVGATKAEGVRSSLSRTAMLALAVTIHNIPEGMSVGVVLAGASDASALSPSAAIAVSLGIAIQNVPEGAIIALPMRSAGSGRVKAFLAAAMSGIVEPFGALAMFYLASHLSAAFPHFLSFAAGSMIYVVVEELIPAASREPHSNLSTIGFAVGFAVMMVLDVVLG